MTGISTQVVHIPVAISARHVHLTQASIECLFGPRHQLHVRRALMQPGQFAAEETVTLIGPKERLTHVRIVGPPREADQVELSRTDALQLGVDAPLRPSGELDRSPGLIVAGPVGCVTLPSGVILAQRHIHMSPADAACLGLCNRETVRVTIDVPGRALTFDDVIVRVSPDFRLELHLDTDEGNAAGLQAGDEGLLVTPVRLPGRVQRITREYGWPDSQ